MPFDSWVRCTLASMLSGVAAKASPSASFWLP